MGTGMADHLTKELEVENELLLDRMIYGTSYYKMVRVDPRDVYWKPRWYVRLGYWLRWNLWRRWL